MTQNNKVPLSRLLLALRAAGYIGQSSYDRAYRAVLSGLIPAEQTVGSKWEIQEVDFPVAAAVLRLLPPGTTNCSYRFLDTAA